MAKENRRHRGEDPPVVERPRTRQECENGPRPCPFIGCKHHLWSDVAKSGSLIVARPSMPPEEMGESCALDLAARGGMTLEEVGIVMNITRERVRQIEEQALEMLLGEEQRFELRKEL